MTPRSLSEYFQCFTSDPSAADVKGFVRLSIRNQLDSDKACVDYAHVFLKKKKKKSDMNF